MRIGQIEMFPTKIICLGRNYLEHALEMKKKVPKEPIFFYKGLNTLILNEESIIYPKLLHDNEEYNQIDHEVELAVIIKKKGKHISKEDVVDFILGYSIFLDIT
ncbi:MAG: acylpyruvase, partial [Candidatus Lokiarchaeota archaeon]|nr:acylpyruvase [Candidatus Lokiarchaeota archaeon]